METQEIHFTKLVSNFVLPCPHGLYDDGVSLSHHRKIMYYLFIYVKKERTFLLQRTIA